MNAPLATGFGESIQSQPGTIRSSERRSAPIQVGNWQLSTGRISLLDALRINELANLVVARKLATGDTITEETSVQLERFKNGSPEFQLFNLKFAGVLLTASEEREIFRLINSYR